jgi:hypothetical protein
MPDMSSKEFSAAVLIGDALQALPLQSPAKSALPAMHAKLQTRTAKPRRIWPLAMAASFAAALTIGISRDPPLHVNSDQQDEINLLQAQSRQLESLWNASRNQNGDATYLVLSMHMEDQLAAIDQALRNPQLDSTTQQNLWQQRVKTLHAATSFETTRDWLNANGQSYNTSLVMTD